MFNLGISAESSLSIFSPLWHVSLEILSEKNNIDNCNLSLMTAMPDFNVSKDLIVKNVQLSNSKDETSLTSFASKLNPFAKPFEIINENILSNTFENNSQIQLSHSYDVVNDIKDVPLPYFDSASLLISDALLDCTPRVINDALTPDVSMRSDSTSENFESLQVDETLVKSPEVSLVIQGKSESASIKFPLDPCALSFSPKNKDITQPVVVELEKSNLIDPSRILSTAPQNSQSIMQLENDMDPKEMMEYLKTKHRDRPIIAHLNINFLDPKFEPLKDIIKDKVDILLVSETKLDDSNPEGRFFIEGYKEPIRLDRNKNGGGLLFFIHDDLECKEIKSHKLPKKTEGIFLKLTIRNSKWLIMGGYNPKKENIKNFLNHIGKELDRFLPNYENLLLLGDFNSEMSEESMKNFCETYNLSNLITDPTCYKSIDNPSCIDVMLTNRSPCFENSTVIETGLSDCHKMTITVMKKTFQKKRTNHYNLQRL